MLNLSENASNTRLLSRRTALRLALTAVPAVAAMSLARPASGASVGAAGTASIRIIDAISRTTVDNLAEARNKLVPGTYRPDRSTTGPIDGIPLTVVGTPNSSVDLVVSRDGQLIENLYIWGDINLGAFSAVTIRNCVVRGGLSRGPYDKSYIWGKGDDLRGASISDTRIEGRPITVPSSYNGTTVSDAGYTSVTNEWRGEAIRGGNYSIRRCEILRTGDGIGLTSVAGNVTIEACWIHQGGYNEWTSQDGSSGNHYYIPAANSSLYTHGDAIQFNRGKNYVIRGNMLGGIKAGSWAHNAGHRADILRNDDFYNSALMIKQEVDNTEANRIRNVLIERNWMAGGTATINITTGRDNDFSDMIIRNNQFLRSTWGTQTYILTPLSNGRPTLAVGDPSSWTGNTFVGDGAPVPYTRGF